MLSEQEFAEFCAIMRVVSFYKSNMDAFREEPEIMSAFNSLQDCTAELLSLLDESERDALLEQYGEELEFLNEHSGKA